MSTFIDRSLPPGDRDDAPALALEPAPLFAAGIEANWLHRIECGVRAAVEDFKDLEHARRIGDWAALQLAAEQLSRTLTDIAPLSRIVARAVADGRSKLSQPAKE